MYLHAKKYVAQPDRERFKIRPSTYNRRTSTKALLIIDKANEPYCTTREAYAQQ